MGYIQQFGNMLSELEDGELKDTLISAFDNVKGDFNQAIDKRNTFKDELTQYKNGIKEVLGADSLEEITAKVDELSQSSSKDIEKLKSDLTAKYEADTAELRGLYESEQSKFNELNSKHETMLFDSEVEKQGLLQGFKTENPRVKQMLLDEIRGNLILDNGVFYVKDNATGEKSRDIKTNEFLSPKSISDSMLNSEAWSDFVSPEMRAEGGGKPPSNQTSATDVANMTPTQMMNAGRQQ